LAILAAPTAWLAPPRGRSKAPFIAPSGRQCTVRTATWPDTLDSNGGNPARMGVLRQMARLLKRRQFLHVAGAGQADMGLAAAATPTREGETAGFNTAARHAPS
jgi:hypothetical protein